MSLDVYASTLLKLKNVKQRAIISKELAQMPRSCYKLKT